MKLLIAGSRDFTNLDFAVAVLNMLIKDGDVIEEGLEIISGMARGADAVGIAIAVANDFKLHQYPAKWDLHGKSAGYKRNVEMGEACDKALIFWDGESKGTKHMIDILNKLKKRHFVIMI